MILKEEIEKIINDCFKESEREYELGLPPDIGSMKISKEKEREIKKEWEEFFLLPKEEKEKFIKKCIDRTTEEELKLFSEEKSFYGVKKY